MELLQPVDLQISYSCFVLLGAKILTPSVVALVKINKTNLAVTEFIVQGPKHSLNKDPPKMKIGKKSAEKMDS